MRAAMTRPERHDVMRLLADSVARITSAIRCLSNIITRRLLLDHQHVHIAMAAENPPCPFVSNPPCSRSRRGRSVVKLISVFLWPVKCVWPVEIYSYSSGTSYVHQATFKHFCFRAYEGHRLGNHYEPGINRASPLTTRFCAITYKQSGHSK